MSKPIKIITEVINYSISVVNQTYSISVENIKTNITVEQVTITAGLGYPYTYPMQLS